MPKESLSRIHHFSLLLSFLLSCPLNFFPLSGGIWVGWMVGGDSICFQSFFFLSRHKKTKNENFLFFLKSKVYLFFSSFFFFLYLRQAWMHWQKFLSNLSFFLFSFSDFFLWLYLFFLLFLCSNFPPFFSILHFLFIISLSILISLPSFKFSICNGKLTKISKRDFIFARVKTWQVGTWSLIE